MKKYGLNSIRIPVGYWLKEDLALESEYFPQGGIEYLDRLAGLASDRGFYIIIDLDGAPGAQWQNQPSTGQVRLCRDRHFAMLLGIHRTDVISVCLKC